MFFCKKFPIEINTMFSKFSDVLQSAADVIAPPPTALQEFEYHWKQIKKFYSSDTELPKVHVNNTNLPHHLESMLQILLKEDQQDDEFTENEEKKPEQTEQDVKQDEINERNEVKNIQTEKKENECLNFILTNRPLDLLLQLSISDSPPGVKNCVLNWLRRFLSCLKEPPLDHASIFQPVQNFILMCNGKNASPYEEEEILFLETVAGLVRKNPYLINIFLSSHQYSASASLKMKGTRVKGLPKKNPLFDCSKLERNIRRVEIIPEDELSKQSKNSNESVIENENNSCDSFNSKHINKSDNLIRNLSSNIDVKCDCEETDKFCLMEGILTYLESPDCKVVVRACESALIISSLPELDMNCSSVAASLEDYVSYLIYKLVMLNERIPEDIDPGDVEESNVSWGLMPRDSEANHFIGKAQLQEFLCWLDYTDCVSRECPHLTKLAKKFRMNFLLGSIEPALVATDTPFVLVLMSKVIKQLSSKSLMEEIANWLVRESQPELYIRPDCLLNIIIENAQDNSEVLLSALQFIEALLDNPHERILHEMIFRYINKRGYYDSSIGPVQSWSDEEDERERRRGSTDEKIKSRTLAPHNILKVINNFLLLLPRQIMVEAVGTCYEEYVQDASRHYRLWIRKTKDFAWPIEAISPEKDDASSISPDSSIRVHRNSSEESSSSAKEPQCNDSGISEESFYEGPLLKLLFSHVRNMALQPCEINLAVIAILSKLAFLPHPYLHEILLNPEIPVAHGASTLWKSMQILSRQLLLEIPKKENFQKRIGEVGKRFLSNPPVLCENYEDGESLFEGIVVLEEFCKELAAIAFVKYHHATE